MNRVWRGFAAAVLLAGVTASHAQTTELTQLKASFVYNFAKLATWPENRFPRPDSPLRLCIARDDPALATMQQVVAGKPVGARVIEVAPIGDSVRGCHLAYLGSDEQGRYAELIPALAAAGALVVDEGERFSWPDGMIRLFLESGRVRFELNPESIQKAKIELDPQLIRLARIASR